MDPQNLQTASAYVNNLLLSRGLLRNGTPIEFAKPSRGEGGANATMAQIINLAHDLVLRRDVSISFLTWPWTYAYTRPQRETDTLSTLSQNMQTMRTTAAQQSQKIERLQNQAIELKRQLVFSVTQERNAKSSLKGVETRNRTLREEMVRLKTTVTQIRSQCANDVRKRDNEVKRLKRHLEGRRGRDGTGGQVGVMVITPGMGKIHNGSTNGHIAAYDGSPVNTLKEDTADFLTQLSRNLTDENEALVELAKNTLATLRNLQGLPEQTQEELISQGLSGSIIQRDPNVSLSIPPSYQMLAANMDEVLEHLRGLLTNPSFVPLEEVEIREDEIIRLREGWDKMEARWREAVALMNGWRDRMMETGDTINLDDLRKGLNLGSEEILKPKSEPSEETSINESTDASMVSATGNAFSVTQDDGQLSQAETIPSQHSDLLQESPIPLFPPPKILGPATGNARRRSVSPRKVSFQVTAVENSDPPSTQDSADELSLLDFTNITPSKRAAGPHSRSKQQEVL